MEDGRTLGTLLRHLVDLLDADVERRYRTAGLAYRPRYTPVMRRLSMHGPSSIRAISQSAGITHSAASQTVAEMVKQGLVCLGPGEDGRERIARLTREGEALLPKLQEHWHATNAAAWALEAEIGIPLHDALAKAIAAVERRSFSDRVAADIGEPDA
jgi:DNA-binding MarR family transcriptional regulator